MASRLTGMLALGLLVAACSAPPAVPSAEPLTPSASPAASLVPIPSAEPSDPPAASPSEMPSEPPVAAAPIRVNAYARVVTDDLRVRSKPGVSEDSEKLAPLLQHSVRVVVLDGPVRASGFDWYQVLPIQVSDTSDEPAYPFGWVAAAGTDGEPWLAAEAPDCPATPADFIELTDLYGIGTSYNALTCFSGQEISFEARVGQPEARCGVATPWGVDPQWFDLCLANETYLVPVADVDAGPELSPAWAPGVDTSIAGPPNVPSYDLPVVMVTGMFDHPAARTCRNRLDQDDADFPEPDPARTVLTCRWTFVVTSMEKVEE